MTMHKEKWTPGERAYFEYHCYQAHDSADASLWYRSHQPVTVVDVGEDPNDEPTTMAERAESGDPLTYHIKFTDGYEGAAFEDELLTSPRYFERLWNPPPASEIPDCHKPKEPTP
ncbi:hypothetical protein LCGC14_1396650 [marine sediment metagenome]|uniref:Uncharacterized protein n=1 Tax=marine sediment metagenome TaxID=412755 RepID=A0A0F9MZY6_9ZZZZ